jgi:hypothetical protein
MLSSPSVLAYRAATAKHAYAAWPGEAKHGGKRAGMDSNMLEWFEVKPSLAPGCTPPAWWPPRVSGRFVCSLRGGPGRGEPGWNLGQAGNLRTRHGSPFKPLQDAVNAR